MILDVHNHLGAGMRTDEPLREPLTSYHPDDLIFHQSVPELLSRMDAARVDRAVVFPFGRAEDGTFRGENDEVIAACERCPRLVPFCRLDPRRGGLAELGRAAEAGARGVKLHPRSQEFTLADRRLGGVLRLAERERMPVLIHTEYVISEDALPHTARFTLPSQFAPLARRHPGLSLIVGHLGRHDARTREELRPLPNVLFDTSTSVLADLVVGVAAYGPERILYGSDSPFSDPRLERPKVDLLPIPEEDRALILGGNSARLLGL